MKINIVAPLKEEWILAKLARMLNEYIPEVTLSEKPDSKADINYFMNWALYEPVKTKTMGWFTHPEDKKFYDVAKKVDWCICHAEQYAEELRKIGCRATTITPGIDNIFKPKLRLGIVGRKYNGDRKGGKIVEAIRELDYVELKFTHHSWGDDVADVFFDNLPNFYNSIDYLLVPAILEGGPVPVGEAIKCGKQVIAPLEIGNVRVFTENIISYNVGGIDNLKNVLGLLYKQRLAISESVENITWRRFIQQHQIIFSKLCQKD